MKIRAGRQVKHESTTEFDTGGERHCCGPLHRRLSAHHHSDHANGLKCCGGVKGKLSKLAFMKRILIIEDDLHIAELERDYLQF